MIDRDLHTKIVDCIRNKDVDTLNELTLLFDVYAVVEGPFLGRNTVAVPGGWYLTGRYVCYSMLNGDGIVAGDRDWETHQKEASVH